MPADRLGKLPDAIDFKTGAAMMLQGMTAQYLLRRTCQVEPGDTILIHAAAGGVGLIVCQWARALGATVIGTVSLWVGPVIVNRVEVTMPERRTLMTPSAG